MGNSTLDSSADKEMKCEVKEYEARFSDDGRRVMIEVTLNPDVDEKDAGKYALRFYRYFTKNNSLEKVNLEIPSPHIRRAIQNVIGSYPDQNLTGNITLAGTSEWLALACLFHYRRELEMYAHCHEDPTARKHVLLAVDFVKNWFRREIRRLEEDLESATHPSIEFSDVWMLFRPGDLIAGGHGPDEFINKVVRVVYDAGGLASMPRWIISAKSFVHDGTNFGYIHRALSIYQFNGSHEVSNLEVTPLKYHHDSANLQQRMAARGQKYAALTGIQYRQYKGEATAVDRNRSKASVPGRSTHTYSEENLQLNGRIVLDCKTFIQEMTDKDIKIQERGNVDQSSPSEEDYLLSHNVVAGFSLSEKRWAWFYVDHITEVDFDEGAFDALMLPQRQKRLLRALTLKHTSGGDGFDDLIQGKGKGCIFLLHGEPGIGKTFTAESIADDIRRPLYVMMSGELGSDVKAVDENLRRVLKLVTAWKAVLLIDEADVFLERRSSADLARNSLVSIFLRTLEYFSGVMFLTTNRINSFDLAFQSRIHLALKYNPLDCAAREQLWTLFLRRTPGFDAASWPPEVRREIAAVDVNGRQIKNTVRTAYAFALSEGAAFGPEHVREVLETVSEFQADFNKDTQQGGEQPEAPVVVQSMGGTGEPDIPRGKPSTSWSFGRW